MIIFLLIFMLLALPLLLLFCSILYTKNKYKSQPSYVIIVLLFIVAILYFGYTQVRYTFIIPLVNFVFQPGDYYAPLIQNEFIFTEKGYSKTYLLPYKHPQIHAVKIRGENDWSGINVLTGKLRAEFFHEDKLLFEQISTCEERGRLLKFTMPLNNKYKSNLSVKLTVIEPFKELDEFDKPTLIEIGVVGN